MQWFYRIKHLKIALVIAALLIAVCSLVVSHFLIRDLEQEEYKRMEIWAEAMRSLNRADETTDLGLVLKVINGNNTIPVIVLDSAGQVEMYLPQELYLMTIPLDVPFISEEILSVIVSENSDDKVTLSLNVHSTFPMSVFLNVDFLDDN